MKFGSIIDVQVNWYTPGAPMSNKQEGYAFVRFEAQSSFEAALLNPTYVVDGITLVCTPSKGGKSGSTLTPNHGKAPSSINTIPPADSLPFTYHPLNSSFPSLSTPSTSHFPNSHSSHYPSDSSNSIESARSLSSFSTFSSIDDMIHNSGYSYTSTDSPLFRGF